MGPWFFFLFLFFLFRVLIFPFLKFVHFCAHFFARRMPFRWAINQRLQLQICSIGNFEFLFLLYFSGVSLFVRCITSGEVGLYPSDTEYSGVDKVWSQSRERVDRALRSSGALEG
jgi:hypothetical protein